MKMPRYIFLHQVKTGGKTVEKFLLRRFGAQFKKTTNLFPEESLNNIFDILATKDVSKLRELEQSDVISGHFPFGLHELLSGECRYFTLLRDPAERIRSYYAYSLKNEGSSAQRFILENELSLEDFALLSAEQIRNSKVHELNYVIENGQAKIIAGVDSLVGADQYTDDELLDQANKNIESYFDYVGVTERFTPAFMHICKMMNLGWFNVYINYNKAALNLEIPPALRAKIHDRNSVDLALHRKFAMVRPEERKLSFLVAGYIVRLASQLAGFYAKVRPPRASK